MEAIELQRMEDLKAVKILDGNLTHSQITAIAGDMGQLHNETMFDQVRQFHIDDIIEIILKHIN